MTKLRLLKPGLQHNIPVHARQHLPPCLIGQFGKRWCWLDFPLTWRRLYYKLLRKTKNIIRILLFFVCLFNKTIQHQNNSGKLTLLKTKAIRKSIHFWIQIPNTSHKIHLTDAQQSPYSRDWEGKLDFKELLEFHEDGNPTDFYGGMLF